jgi:threonine dehydrogenase-like Zn-dependent dehydrogenase
MKAVRFLGSGRVSVDDIPEPLVGAFDVLIEPLAVGVCGTDIHIVEGDYRSSPPVVLGHEVCGRVVATGESVVALAIGDLVTVEPHLYCGVCIYCQTGKLNMCPNRRAPGVHLDGGMAELLAVPETLAYLLPPSTPPHHGALTEPIACAVHAMDRLAPASGLPVAIFGAGPAGVILIALSALAGTHPVVSIEPRAHRRALALRAGADIAIDPNDSDFGKIVDHATSGNGFAYVVDAVGSARILESAVEIASRGAKILVFGVSKPEDVAAISPNDVYARELSILGSALNPFTHRRAANLLPSLPLDELHCGFFGLDDVADALDAQRAGTFDKVFVTPQEKTSAR